MAHSAESEVDMDEKSSSLYHQLYPTHLDPLANETRFNSLIEKPNFGNDSIVHKVEILNGRATHHQVDLNHVLAHPSQAIAGQQNGGCLEVFFLSLTYSNHHTNLSQRAFLRLLDICDAPPSYVDVIFDNNGTYTSYVVHDLDDESIRNFYVLLKLPFGPQVNGSVMFRHSFKDNHTSCIISLDASRSRGLLNRLMGLENPGQVVSASSINPFVILGLFLDYTSTEFEDERKLVDRRVCFLESKSGVALHNFAVRKAKVTEYALLKRDLHMMEGLLAMQLHMLSFQAELSSFLLEEQLKFCKLQQSGAGRQERRVLHILQEDYLQASLSLSTSMARWRFSQVKVLSKRIQIQVKVIESSIDAQNTFNGLRLAQDTRSDSVSMKAITLLTMSFLPATFVATVFGMGFFDFADARNGITELRVSPQVWMYVAVTIPLTAVVLGACALWLKWNERRLAAEEGGETLAEAANSSL